MATKEKPHMPAIKYKKKTYAGATFPVLEMTKAEYDALPDAKKMDGTVYMITDDNGGWEAERSTYDNTASGLTATNVQAALDELTTNSTFLSTKQFLFNSISLAANATTSINVADITLTGYKPLMYSFQPGDWSDHISFGAPAARIEGNAVKIGTIYLMNVSNAEAQAATMYINILWQKI